MLYVETNAFLSFATGRDRSMEDIVFFPPDSVRLAVPSVCFMEAFSLVEAERKHHRRFLGEFEKQVTQVARSIAIPESGALVTRLQLALGDLRQHFGEFEPRLGAAFAIFAANAELIHPKPSVLLDSLDRPLIEEPTDNLILSIILDHAGRGLEEPKAFLSENHKDFGGRSVKAALLDRGVKYFSDAGQCLDWLKWLDGNPDSDDPSGPSGRNS